MPRFLIEALPRHLERLEGSEIFLGLVLEDFPLLPGTRIETFFPSGPFATEAGQIARDAHYSRLTLHELAADFAASRRPVDVVLGQGGIERGGRHSLGITVDFLHAAAEQAQHVLLEVHASTPWTGDRSAIEATPRVRAIAAPRGPMEAGPAMRSPDSPLARNLLPWIPDGATLEFGIGQWFPPLIGALAEARRGLRLHTGQLGPWVDLLIQAGALDDGVAAIGCGAAGPAEFYRFIDDNPLIRLAPANFTHDPGRLARLPAFRAINSVFEIDLFGRANSELSPAGIRGGIAGLPDFARGAVANPEGLSIIVLSSTARGKSRIVPRIACSPASLTTAEIDIVVTEVGSADIRGLSNGDRAEAIIAIAAEEHRPLLREAAAAMTG